MGRRMWTKLLLVSALALGASADYLMGGHLDNKNTHQIKDDASASLVLARTAEDDFDLLAEESSASVVSTPYPDQEPRYKIPYAFAFNGGKPFSLEKDPITGKIDFEKTPPLKALNLTDTYQDEEELSEEEQTPAEDRISDAYPYGKVGYIDSKRVVSTNSKNERVGPNEINPYSPSFHDFLNLPVKYSSDKYEKDKYPLISSSYANTKVQSGSNSYNIDNHRPYHQETATKVSISTATRKVYYPKSTSRTTTTTQRPETIPTTTTTTTARPITRATRPTTTTVRPTRPPTTTTTTTTTTQSPTVVPKVTTWKPPKSTGRYDEYEDVLPIEKLQSNKYGSNFPMHDKEFNGHNNGPQSPSRPVSHSTYDYNEGFEDYESVAEEQPQADHPHHQSFLPTTVRDEPTTITTTVSPSTTTSTAAPTTTTSQTYKNVHITSAESVHPPVVTSMPLDSSVSSNSNNPNPHVPSVHENYVESHRPVDFFNGNQNNNNPAVNGGHQGMHFPGMQMYGRPGSVISVLPESTSNVIVPHDQDTVSFVLGNRQNVEGSYYTHGVAMEEHLFAPNSNQNTFRPVGFGSQMPTIPQSPIVDQKMSVGLPSVAIVEPSQQAQYDSQKWYSQVPLVQPPSKLIDVEPNQNQKPQQSTLIFPSSSSNNNNNESTQKDEATVSGFVNFPDQFQDKKDEQAQNNPNQQRPLEEHLIIINQADGSIKEVTPTGQTNVAENSVILNSNLNNNANNDNNNNNYNANNNFDSNNPNLPQLAENLTPPTKRPRLPPGPGNNQRPPFNYFNYQHGPNSGPNPANRPPPQRIPLPPRQKPEAPPVGFKRRPTPHDPKLPNILPQFRPNAKTSHGHRGSEKIGTLPASQSFNNRQRPPQPQQSPPPHIHPSRRPQPPHPNSPPPHFHRLSPPPPPNSHNHPPTRGPSPPHQHHPHHNPHVFRKKEDVGPPPNHNNPNNPEHLKRYRPGPVQQQQQPPQHNQRPPVIQKLRMDDEIGSDRFSAEPPQVPPRPIIFPKNRADTQAPKVATLQMIQQRGGLDEDIIKANLPPVFKIINRSDEKGDEVEDNKEDGEINDDTDRRKDESSSSPDAHNPSNAGGSEAGPVYVVYPVNSAVNIGSQEDTVERDESVVIGTRGPHRPLPPDTLPGLSDDEENDNNRRENENIHNHNNNEDKLLGYGGYYGKRPHQNAVNSDFGAQSSYEGYPYDHQQGHVHEKPLLVPSDEAEEEEEEDKKPEDSTFNNVISYLQDYLPFGTKKQQPQQPSTISATLPRLPILKASSPIAYVYTPTTPPPSIINRHDVGIESDNRDPYEGILHIPDHRDEKPILLPSQQPSSSSSSAPSPQNFMAPFIASVSAEMPPKNGWSVVVTPGQVNGTERTKEQPEAEKKIDEQPAQSSATSQENDSQTEKSDAAEDNFDPENFKPQLFGGFKPIYEFPVDEEEQNGMVGRGGVGKAEIVNVNADAGRMIKK